MILFEKGQSSLIEQSNVILQWSSHNITPAIKYCRTVKKLPNNVQTLPTMTHSREMCYRLNSNEKYMLKVQNIAHILITVGITNARPVLNVWQQYARVELSPPSLRDIPAIRSGFTNLIHAARTGRYREVTVREAIVNTLVFAEVYCWFYIGECIGKRHIVGYKV